MAPSKPICKIQGKAEYGQNINLTCLSEEGSPPPTYKWDSRDVRNMPRAPAPRTTDSEFTDTDSDASVESGKKYQLTLSEEKVYLSLRKPY